MKKNEGSTTAQIVAFGRAYHALHDEDKIFHDPLAKHMLSHEEYSYIENRLPKYIGLIEPLKQFKFRRTEGASLKRIVHRLVAPAPLERDRYTLDFLKKELPEGVEQYVIMGAGLDTFAFNHPELLDKLTVFEVDHPATQKNKLQRIESLGWDTHENHRFVPVDFQEDDFSKCLVQAGFDPDKKTVFAWLGVTYYLTKEAISNTLTHIKKLSNKGNYLIFDYPDKNFYSFFKTSLRVKIMVLLVKTVNEPMKAGYSYDEIEKELKSHGFGIHEHLTREDIQKLYFSNRNDDYSAFENINIMCAITE